MPVIDDHLVTRSLHSTEKPDFPKENIHRVG